MSRAEERPTESADNVVTGLRPGQEQAPTATYFAAFGWEPPEVDPEQLTASEFFARLLEADEGDVPGSKLPSVNGRYLASVEIELVDDSVQPPIVVKGAAGPTAPKG